MKAIVHPEACGLAGKVPLKQKGELVTLKAETEKRRELRQKQKERTLHMQNKGIKV